MNTQLSLEAESMSDSHMNPADNDNLGPVAELRSERAALSNSHFDAANSVTLFRNNVRSTEALADKNAAKQNSTQEEGDWVPEAKQKLIQSPWAFPVAVVRAFQTLPESRQAAILHRWPHFNFIVSNLTTSFTAKIPDLDPKPVMAILIANPGGPTGDIIRLMEKRYANMLVQCARSAFESFTPRVLREAESIDRKRKSTIKKLKIHNKAIGNENATIPKDPTDDVMEYAKLIAYYEKYWNAGVPQTLYSMGNDHDHFYYSTNPKNPLGRKMHMGRLMCPGFIRHSRSGARGGDHSFVADIDEILQGIHDQIVNYPENPYFKPAKITPNITAVTRGLNFSNLENMFNKTLPELRVGMSLWSATLWTGIGKY
ncbi:hypothetical protein BGZ63DRAFT_433179 [Mariannaea sp. PMI_226]|nr:hypothetical protein BGZ63DRAFT_433179 [Mariannaea sp. PMI_226]